MGKSLVSCFFETECKSKCHVIVQLFSVIKKYNKEFVRITVGSVLWVRRTH